MKTSTFLSFGLLALLSEAVFAASLACSGEVEPGPDLKKLEACEFKFEECRRDRTATQCSVCATSCTNDVEKMSICSAMETCITGREGEKQAICTCVQETCKSGGHGYLCDQCEYYCGSPCVIPQ